MAKLPATPAQRPFATWPEVVARVRHPLRSRTLVLALLLALLQYPLWVGQGSWLAVRRADEKVAAQVAVNAQLQARNDVLAADVQDLQKGGDAIEERARSELGMVKPDEIYVRIVRGPLPTAPAAPQPAPQTQNQVKENQAHHP